MNKRFSYRRNYVAMSPAVNWFALYDDGKKVKFEPLVVWAAYADSDGGSGVVGLLVDEDYPDLCEAGDLNYFCGYFSKAEIALNLERFRAADNLPVDERAN